MRVRLTAVAKSIRSSTSPVQGITAMLITLVAGAGPWLVHHGHGGLAVYAGRVPGWWPAIPASVLVILAVVKANWELYVSGEVTNRALKARLADRAQRKMDAAELGALGRRMRRRYLEWLKEQNHTVRLLGFASARAQMLQNEIATMLEERYGVEVRDRFIAAADPTNPRGVLSESRAYAGRIARLRDIIVDIRRGKIKRGFQ